MCVCVSISRRMRKSLALANARLDSVMHRLFGSRMLLVGLVNACSAPSLAGGAISSHMSSELQLVPLARARAPQLRHLSRLASSSPRPWHKPWHGAPLSYASIVTCRGVKILARIEDCSNTSDLVVGHGEGAKRMLCVAACRVATKRTEMRKPQAPHRRKCGEAGYQ